MIYTAIIVLALCMASCSFRSVYPTLGGIAGGGVGSLGGPGTAALGAGAGGAGGGCRGRVMLNMVCVYFFVA